MHMPPEVETPGMRASLRLLLSALAVAAALTLLPASAGAVSGTATITVDPPATNLGEVDLNTPGVPVSITVTNTSGVSASNVIATVSDPAEMNVNLGSCMSVAPGGQCTLTLTFLPVSTGDKLITFDVAGSNTNTVSGNSIVASVIDPTMSVDVSSHDFGTIDFDSPSRPTSDFTISNTGTGPLTIQNLGLATGTSFVLVRGSCAATQTFSIAAGASCTIGVTFDPAGTGGAIDTVNFTSNDPDNPVGAVEVAGSAYHQALSGPSTYLQFGMRDIDAGPTATQTVTLTNDGAVPTTVGGASILGTYAGDFEIVSDGCSVTLAPGETCGVTLAFDPHELTLGGTAMDVTLSVGYGLKGASYTLPLEGTATLDELTGPAPVSFPQQQLGSGASAPRTLSFRNMGTETVTIHSVTLGGADAGDFTKSADYCSSVGLLYPGEICTIDIAFDPQSAGTRLANLAISYGTWGKTLNLAISGAAITPPPPAPPAPQLSVSLAKPGKLAKLRKLKLTAGCANVACSVAVSGSLSFKSAGKSYKRTLNGKLASALGPRALVISLPKSFTRHAGQLDGAAKLTLTVTAAAPGGSAARTIRKSLR